MADLPETQVLAIASHVSFGYVGNTMATFVMQSLGCEVTAINTVQFSNHTGYKQFKGRKTPSEEVSELYQGLRQSGLDDFDVMLSGYCPSAAVVEEVGKIARERKLKSSTKPGSFFWILDPVMGDNGKIYVSEDVVPAYKGLIKDADLILPNQFEAEVLSGVTITDYSSLAQAIRTLHTLYRVPHVIITSVSLPATGASTPKDQSRASSPTPRSKSAFANMPKLSIIGSTARQDMSPRLFRITVPAFPVFFSGTGDMFAALMVVRLREACQSAQVLDQASWTSPDDVSSTELPLAKAAEKVLASMNAILDKTAQARETEVKRLDEAKSSALNEGKGAEAGADQEKERYLRLTKAAEVKVVKHVQHLINPPDTEAFRAQPLEIETDEPGVEPDELGVVKVGAGEGAVHYRPS